MRGEKAFCLTPAEFAVGSPPHARGKVSHVCVHTGIQTALYILTKGVGGHGDNGYRLCLRMTLVASMPFILGM